MTDTRTKSETLTDLRAKLDSYEERLTASGNISKAIQHFLKERREDIEKAGKGSYLPLKIISSSNKTENDMPDKRLHSHRWETLDQYEIEDMITDKITLVTCRPGTEIIQELKRLGYGTLEVLEDRTMTTVYRIRETGKVYQQLGEAEETVRQFYDYKEYRGSPAIDKLLRFYESTDPVFIISKTSAQHLIWRKKDPKFVAEYDPETRELLSMFWDVDPPSEITRNSILKKAKWFLRANVKPISSIYPVKLYQ